MGEHNNLSNSKIVRKKPFMPKVVITTILGLGITVGSVTADTNNDSLPRVYHVYIDGEHLGTVGSKDVIESFIDEKASLQEKKNEEQLDGVQLTVSQDITYVPEVAFAPVFDNEQVLKNLEEQIQYSVEAVKLEVDGVVIGYFNNKETAQEVLKTYLAKYLPEDEVEKFINPSDEPGESKDNQPLSVGESTILDAKLSEEVSFKTEKVKMNELFTVEQGLKMLEKGALTDKVHTIQEGEALSTVAAQYDLSMDDLLTLNPDLNEDSVIQIGQEVTVTGLEPIVDVVVTEEELTEETIDYEIVYEQTDSLFKGQTSVKQNGQEGKKRVHYKITKKNGQVVDREVLDSEVTKEPVNKIILEGTKVIPSRGTGSFRWPAAGGFITSHVGYRWGSYHKGIDIAGVGNRSIYAADNGTVTYAGWDGGYGNRIVINHNNGYKTTYSHLSSIDVHVGQTVQQGQVIGVMGSTGNSTGVHLHFELYKNGALQNPASYY